MTVVKYFIGGLGTILLTKVKVIEESERAKDVFWEERRRWTCSIW